MQYFYVLVFFVNGEMDHGFVTQSEEACSDLMQEHLDHDGDLFCWSTGQVSSSIRPPIRPAHLDQSVID